MTSTAAICAMWTTSCIWWGSGWSINRLLFNYFADFLETSAESERNWNINTVCLNEVRLLSKGKGNLKVNMRRIVFARTMWVVGVIVFLGEQNISSAQGEFAPNYCFEVDGYSVDIWGLVPEKVNREMKSSHPKRVRSIKLNTNCTGGGGGGARRPPDKFCRAC